MLPLTGDIPPFVAVNEGIFPVPPAARPIAGLLFVHEKVVPLPTGLVTKVTGAVIPLQKVWPGIGSTAGVGFTVMV